MGPLQGLKVIEFAGIGPGPMCAMLLADMGASVLRIDRIDAVELGQRRPLKYDVLLRNRRSIPLDLKRADAAALALRLVERADALIEGFRPGVTERLGLGPDVCLSRNPKLVYGRMTGWGQDGPYAPYAGHDLNYISLAGVAAHIGRVGADPTPPLNLVGDYGGGAMFLAYGVVCGRFVFAPLMPQTGQRVLIGTIALAIVLQEYLRLAQGSKPQWVGPMLNAPTAVARAGDFVVTVTPAALGAVGASLLAAGAVLEGGVIDPAMLEEAVLDVLVDGQDRFDVLQVVEAWAVGDLVEGADGDEVGLDRIHGIPAWQAETVWGP